MHDQPVVWFEDVTFAYNGDPVLESVNLKIERGDSVYVVGPNGGGKTTLLKLILGLLKPMRGEITVLGADPKDVRLRIGYMPQYIQFDPLFPVTVLDIVLMGRLGRSFSGRYSNDDREAADKALEGVGINELSGKCFAELSGGQRQRALIARALCDDPELLLLDEPTSHVDVQGESKLLEILSGLHKKMSIMMISHDLGFVPNIFERVVFVNRKVRAVKTCDIQGDVIKEMYGDDHTIIHYHG